MNISIHAPRTGSDRQITFFSDFLQNFNPRSPHGERLYIWRYGRSLSAFQSTLPARGATWCACDWNGCFCISIHAPRTGSDERLMCAPIYCETFQSTLPARGATLPPPSCRASRRISIHAPRTGSDRLDASRVGRADISIHAPRTGSDLVNLQAPDSRAISIHAPRTGSDRWLLHHRLLCCSFQSTLPARGATGRRCFALLRVYAFQSTLPARGATAQSAFWSLSMIFQSTLPARGATGFNRRDADSKKISIHAPRTGSDFTFLRTCKHNYTISIHAPRTGSD